MFIKNRLSSQNSDQSSATPASPLKAPDTIHISSIAIFIFIVLGVVAYFGITQMDAMGVNSTIIYVFATVVILAAFYALFSVKVASQWQKAVVLRLGKFHALKGPGIFLIFPIVNSTPIWIDHRVMVTPFNAEKSLTKDTVPVDVDAVLFWVVWDAEKAALEVESYRSAIAWAAQTALREIIGQMYLAEILVGRKVMDEQLQHIIDERTTPWGITVQSVEIRDVIIPQALEDAMSRQAQAERERQARVILGESEQQIAASFAQAAETYSDNPTALHLRAMNMLFEGLSKREPWSLSPAARWTR